MKNFIFASILTFVFCFMAFSLLASTSTGLPDDFNTIFSTFAALVAVIPILTEAVKKLIGVSAETPNWIVQTMSWVVGLAVSLVGYFFNLGFLADKIWYEALLYGFAASLAANGVADTKLIEWVFNLFVSNRKEEPKG